MEMYLGLLATGMALGLASAAYLFVGYGSFLAAVAAYSIVATLFVLVASALSFVLSESAMTEGPEETGSVTPAE